MIFQIAQFLFYSGGVLCVVLLLFKKFINKGASLLVVYALLMLIVVLGIFPNLPREWPLTVFLTFSAAALLWFVVIKSGRDLYKDHRMKILQQYNDVVGDLAGCGLAITDSAGIIVMINDCIEKIFGYSRSELIGKNISKLFLAPASPSPNEYFFSSVEANDEFSSEGRTRDDTSVSLHIKAKSLVTAFGRFRVLLISDTSPKVDLHSSDDDKIKSAYYDFAPMIFIALNADGIVQRVNNHGERLIQMKKRDIIGENWFDRFVPDHTREECRNIFDECLASGNERHYKSLICDVSGCERLIQWKCGIIVTANEKLVLYTGEDITDWESEHNELKRSLKILKNLKADLEERVKARTRDLENININLELQIDERKQIEEQLINSERLHLAMARNFPNGIIAVLDSQMRFVLIEGKELSEIGYAHKQLIGKSIFDEDFGIISKSAFRSLQLAFAGETTGFEVTHINSIYNVIAVPLPDQQNNVEEILVVIYNITESKRLEESLYKTIEQEKKLNELKSRFVTMASHEFRTPLSTILSSVFLMENYSGALYEEKKHIHINRIKRTVNILTETLNDFLRLGKLEEGRIEMILSDINIRDHVYEILGELQSVTKPGQTIFYEHSGTDIHVLIDKNLVRGVLVNLLSNALKYSPEGSKVIVTTQLSDSELIIEVIDSGIGIAPEEREHIFQRFFRALNAVHIEGTGLGLHIVKKYVDLMNGTIDFVSGDGGTTFTVKIPLQLTRDKTRLILH